MDLINGKRWFEQEEDRFVYRVMAPPFENILVGSTPDEGMTLETSRSFDVFINLRTSRIYSYDEDRPRPDTRFYHIPIDESGYWGYRPFYDTKLILDKEYDDGSKIYLHCNLGANRSPAIALAWLMSRGYQLEEASGILNEFDESMKWINLKRFYLNIFECNIPPRLEDMYLLMKKGKNLEEILDMIGVRG